MIITILTIICLVILLAGIFVSVFFSISGTWERVGDRKDQIQLGQFGPIVVGRREIVGGYQLFSGWAVGPYIWLKRRDFGPASLVKEGFPQLIAEQLEGQTMAKLRLRLSKDRLFLNGQFWPKKVEFIASPPRLLEINTLPPQARRYRRVELVAAREGQKEMA